MANGGTEDIIRRQILAQYKHFPAFQALTFVQTVCKMIFFANIVSRRIVGNVEGGIKWPLGFCQLRLHDLFMD